MRSLPQNSDETPRLIRDAAHLGSRLGLERVARLCALLGDPQNRVPCVHVAGTNGKGSVCATLASIFREAGLRTGLYTSPYIDALGECLKIDGRPISSAEIDANACSVESFVRQMGADGEAPTQFEIETALAFHWFAQSKCDVSVIETGLGGRLDATNVIAKPFASVITSISMDHMGILGDTKGRIAGEKCGIIKQGGATVAYPAQDDEVWRVIRERAAAQGNPLAVPDLNDLEEIRTGLGGTDIAYRGLAVHIPLVGRHQTLNAATAIETALLLRKRYGLAIPDEAIACGIGKTRVPLRQEWLAGAPGVLLDGAHNPDGLLALADTVRRNFHGRVAAVMGMLADKDCETSIGFIAGLCGKFVACAPHNPRALPSAAAADLARKHCPDVAARDDVAGAIAEAKGWAGPDGAVVVCGSLYLAGPARRILLGGAG